MASTNKTVLPEIDASKVTIPDITLAKININEFTDNVSRDDIEHIVVGDGIFDKLMETATQHLKAQFEGNRFREEDYAAAYVQIYQATLQAALQAWLQKGIAETEMALKAAELPIKAKQLELLQNQLALLAAQEKTEEGKAALYRRQIEGFDESYKEKILKILLDAWGIGFSVGSDAFTAENIPAPMKEAAISKVFNEYVMRDIDSYAYSRINDTIKEVVPGSGALKDPVI